MAWPGLKLGEENQKQEGGKGGADEKEVKLRREQKRSKEFGV